MKLHAFTQSEIFRMRLVAVSVFWLHVLRRSVQACSDTIHIRSGDNETGLSYEYTISPPEIHMKLSSFYFDNSRPPFKEVYFIHRMTDEQLAEVSELCYPLVLLSELLVAEAELAILSTSPVEAPRFKSVWSQLAELAGEEVARISRIWPIHAAVHRFNGAFARLKPVTPLSVSFVICHCKERLGPLLSNLSHVPMGSSLFVYEKCGIESAVELVQFNEKFSGGITVIAQPDGLVRGDECTAYLHFIETRYESLPDVTVFLQADTERHAFVSYLNTALATIQTDQYDVGFLHLNFHRHYQTTTPCMRDVERLLFGLPDSVPPTPLIGTYCCAQFIVKRERISARPKQFYSHALSLVNGSVNDVCSSTPPRRSSHCYVLEYLWHVVFGEPRFLPHRPDNPELPLILRMKYGNENAKSRWDDVVFTHWSGRFVHRTVDVSPLRLG